MHLLYFPHICNKSEQNPKKWTIYKSKKKNHKTLKFQETTTFLLRRVVVIVGD
jgi:hypothetical protein